MLKFWGYSFYSTKKLLDWAKMKKRRKLFQCLKKWSIFHEFPRWWGVSISVPGSFLCENDLFAFLMEKKVVFWHSSMATLPAVGDMAYSAQTDPHYRILLFFMVYGKFWACTSFLFQFPAFFPTKIVIKTKGKNIFYVFLQEQPSQPSFQTHAAPNVSPC